MKRTLTLAMLLSLSATSPLALALGLGEAEVDSTLSAPLRASIPLTDTAGLAPGLLNVSVADAEAFAAAGLARTPLAASVEMSVSRREGRLVVDLTTERAVREPWLDLLLRFDWPGGRQLREVTLLLDPPDYDRLPVLVAAPSTAPRTSASPSRLPRSASEAAPGRAVPVSVESGAGDSARVGPGDTLWSVAGRLRPDSGISMNQMMVALVAANPQVFPSGNINAMRAGFTLEVPPREAIASRSDARAGELVLAMNQAWTSRGDGAPARVFLGDGAPAAGGEEADAESTAVAARNGGRRAGEGGQRLTLLSDDEVAAEGGLVIQEGLGDRASDVVAARGEGETSAPAPSSSERGEEGALDPEVLARRRGGGEPTEDQRLLHLEARWQESREDLAAMRSERDALQAALGDLREEVEAMRSQLARLAAGDGGSEAAGAGGMAAPGSATSMTESTPWWAGLYQQAVDRPLVLGGAGLAVLLAFWALVRRGRRDEEGPVSVFDEARPVRPLAAGRGEPGGDEPRTSPLRASMPEAETINEAEIFIAYGRFEQARELLEASLAREPDRDELRLKLLRVQLEQGDRGAAARQAEQLRAGGDADVQAEVAQLMQRHAVHTASIAPERALFPEPDEHRPRRLDEPGARALGGDPPAAEGTLGQAAPEPAGGRTGPARDTEEGDAVRDEGRETPREPGGDASPRSRTQAEECREIIDYRPPPLEATPAPREETPMQPSVDFTPSALDGSDTPPTPAGSSPGGEPWDVEEVAFPPLSRDNARLSATVSPASTLAEARRLMDAGQRDRSRALLERLIGVTDDPDAREEARELLDQHLP